MRVGLSQAGRRSCRYGRLVFPRAAILRVTLCLPLAPACTDRRASAVDSGTGDSGTGDLVELTVEPSAEVASVAEVGWASIGATDARVEYEGLAGEPGGSVPATLVDGIWQASVVGPKPGHDYVVRAYGQLDGGDLLLGESTFSAGALPSSLPALTVERDGSGRGPGFVLTTLLTRPSTIVLLDPDGDIVWWVDTPLADHFVIRAHPDRDGSGVLALSQPSDDALTQDTSALLRIPWSGMGIEVLNLQGGHHDFVQTGEEQIVYIAGDTVVVDGVEVHGDQLIRRDPDGSMAPVWSVWEHDSPDPDQTGADWTHANALDWDPDTRRLRLGMRNLSTIVEIDSVSRQPVWEIGGERSVFEFGEGAAFTEQHQFELVAEDRLLVFDNGDPAEQSSRVVELSLDFERHLAERVWEYRPDPSLYCFGPGEVRLLDDGLRLVSWGSAGLIEVVDEDLAVPWRVEAPLSTAFGYVSPVEAPGAPGP